MSNPHFLSVPSLDEAAELVGFTPREPSSTAGFDRSAIRLFVRDHRMRDVPAGRRVLELHYDGFVVSQSRPGPVEARRLALDVAYGRTPIELQILGRPGRIFELGPEPDPDDVDGRSPAVVTWFDAGVHYLVASDRLPSQQLVDIAMSMYR